MTVATPLLGKFLGIVSGLSLGIRVSILKSVALTVLELLAFNSHDRPLRTHTHTDKHTSNERIISAIHFVHLAEIIMKIDTYCQWCKSLAETLVSGNIRFVRIFGRVL